jgi:hypothetical protein
MNAEEIYKKIKAMSHKEKLDYFKKIDPDEYDTYMAYKKRLANKKYNRDPQVKARDNMERREYIAAKRKEEPEKFKEQRKEHDKKYREKKRGLKEVKKQATEDIKSIINDIIEDIPKKAEANQVAASIINDILDKVPIEIKRKRNNEAAKASRLRKKLASVGFTEDEILKDIPYKKVGRPRKIK